MGGPSSYEVLQRPLGNRRSLSCGRVKLFQPRMDIFDDKCIPVPGNAKQVVFDRWNVVSSEMTAPS